VVAAKISFGTLSGPASGSGAIYDVVYRASSGGDLAWTDKAPNAVVNAALNYVLNVALGGGTQITTWYIGLVSNAGTPTFAAGDTHVTHAWTEFTDYSETTRQAWTPVTSTAQSITNTTAATFSITGPGTLKGLFMSNVNTKGSTRAARPSSSPRVRSRPATRR
jgi:hypothetical protein